MSISRRIFIKVGTLAAVAAGVSLKPGLAVLGQDLPGKLTRGSTDPLANYTQATFEQYVGSIFTLRSRVRVELTLARVVDSLPRKVARTGGRESFELHFRGGSVGLTQDSYVLEHPALGTFMMFLVPSGTDENGAQGYVAIINRLSFAAKPSTQGIPRKSERNRAPVKNEAKPEQGPARTEPLKPSIRGSVEPEGSAEIQS
jgi:Domain of unknown function (DUF6916)